MRVDPASVTVVTLQTPRPAHRRPGWSAGTTFRESALVIRSLGARDAMDFDDGGSTAMTVGTRVVNGPSDPGGERAVSDGLFVLPS